VNEQLERGLTLRNFSSPLAEKLYEARLDSMQESVGSVDELGWFALFVLEKAILHEDSQGFVGVAEYETGDAMQAVWNAVLSEYAKFNAGEEVISPPWRASSMPDAPSPTPAPGSVQT